MNKIVEHPRIPFPIITTFLFSIFCCALATWVIALVNDGVFARWQSLGKPPELPQEIVGMNLHWEDESADVYIESANGDIYIHQKDGKGWERTSLPQDLYSNKCFDPYYLSREPYFARLPAKITDCNHIPWSFEWLTITTYFVILEDGSVWYWQLNQSSNFLLEIVCLCGSPFIGILMGWGWFQLIWSIRKRVISGQESSS